MIILQFQVTNTSKDEINLVPDFCKWLIRTSIYDILDSKTNEDKVKVRIDYIKNVEWIKWKNKKNYQLDESDIISNILDSFIVKSYKDNIFKIESDSTILVKNSYTSIDRLIRFINSGDNTFAGTNMITNIQFKLNLSTLNTLWRVFILDELGDLPSSRLITKIY